MENVIYFSGVDMINETPVLDIKPYIPQYDNPGIYYVTEHLVFYSLSLLLNVYTTFITHLKV